MTVPSLDVRLDCSGGSIPNFGAALPDYGNVFVCKQSCFNNTSGIQNCSITCQDDVFWQDLRDFHNCLLYPVLATRMGTGNLTEHAEELLNSIGFTPVDALAVGTGIMDAMSTCLTVLCITLSNNTADFFESKGHYTNLTDLFLFTTLQNPPTM